MMVDPNHCSQITRARATSRQRVRHRCRHPRHHCVKVALVVASLSSLWTEGNTNDAVVLVSLLSRSSGRGCDNGRSCSIHGNVLPHQTPLRWIAPWTSSSTATTSTCRHALPWKLSRFEKRFSKRRSKETSETSHNVIDDDDTVNREDNNRNFLQQPLTTIDEPPPPPLPPTTLPLRFLKAGKDDPVEGWRRYRATLEWRKNETIDTLLRDAHPDFSFIKEHYPHYYHLTGRRGEPVYYEQPARTDLRTLRKGGVTLDKLLRHYSMITEFQWQYLCRDDAARSIFVLDLIDIRVSDFAGATVDFVKRASRLSAQHYPERAGHVLVVNVPRWFQLIWKVMRPLVDETTLEKIRILRGPKEIQRNLVELIPLERIPPEYGGTSMPLGQAPEEDLLRNLMRHNNELAANGQRVCDACRTAPGGDVAPSRDWRCQFCQWKQARSY